MNPNGRKRPADDSYGSINQCAKRFLCDGYSSSDLSDEIIEISSESDEPADATVYVSAAEESAADESAAEESASDEAESDEAASDESYLSAYNGELELVSNPSPAPLKHTYTLVCYYKGAPSIGYDANKRYFCTICREEIIDHSELVITMCHHTFHKNCLLHEMKSRKICPICRRELVYIVQNIESNAEYQKKNIYWEVNETFENE